MLAEMLSDLGEAAHVVADLRRNQVLLRGPEKAHQIARQLIDSVDRPPGGTATAKPEVKAYRCAKDRLARVVAELRLRYAEHEGVRIASDPESSQVLVLAPPHVHEMIARELSAVGVPGAGGNAGAGGEAGPKSLAKQVPGEEVVGLAHSRVERIESQLRQLLGSRLEPRPNRPPGRPDYRFVDTAGRSVELTVDRQGNGILIVGAQPLVRQFVILVHALDALEGPHRQSDRTVRILPVHRADPTKVRQAVDAYRSGSSADDNTDRGRGQAGSPKTQAPGKGDMGWGHPRDSRGVELAQYAAPSAGADAEPNGPSGVEPIPTTEEELKELEAERDRLRELGEDVEIETLPDLDVIILRGRDRDIDEVSRIIAEIERLSQIAEPVIEIYKLKHVSSEGVVEILELVAEDVAGGRQGSVHMTDLVKPNAILLIGWGEALEATKELIAKLDQPVAPQAQLRLFSLRNAPASSAAATLNDVFSVRSGLGPRVEVQSDARTNCLIVRAAPRDMAEVELLVKQFDRADSDAVMQTRTYKLRHALADDVAATLQDAIDAAAGEAEGETSAILELLTADVEEQRLLRSGLLDNVQIIPDSHTNTLIITAPAESMDLLMALIEQLDSPTGVAQIKVFQIINGDANTMVEMLRSLLPTQTGAAGPQLAGAEGETTLVPLRFAVDIRTNSIIATGSEGDLAIIEALLLRLDAEEIEQRKNTVYRLRNAPAPDVAEAINEFLRSERAVELAAPGAESPFRQIEREVVVVPEPVTNSLIISATPRFYEEIETMVEDLDRAPAQVMIQVVIAEVVLDSMDEFGVELGLQDSLLFDRSLLGELVTITESTLVPGVGTVQNQRILASPLTPGFVFNNEPLGNNGSEVSLANSNRVGGQALSHFAVGRTNPESGYGGLVLSASSESVSVLIRALEETSRIDILGRPQIMTLDNQPAYIQVGKMVPRIAATSFRATYQTNEIVLEPTGLIMAVTPRVSPEGVVVMEIDAQKSDLGPEAEGIPISFAEGQVIRQPSISITLAQTTVSAASVETIVLGGLITTKETGIHRRVPWLHQVPVLGNLFRFDSETETRAELLIILTPYVIRSQEEAERIKQVEAARMSWCLADVHAIHGPTGLYDDRDNSAWQGQGEVIYPDLNPRGQKPGEFVPKEVCPENLELSPPIQEPEPAPSEKHRKPQPPSLWDSLWEDGPPARPAPKEDLKPAGNSGQPASAVKQTSWTSPPPGQAGDRPDSSQGLVSTEFSVPLTPTEPSTHAEPPRSAEPEPQEQPAKSPFRRFFFAKP
jgi:type II secretion system protein D